MEIFEYHHKTATSENVALSENEIQAKEIAYASWLAAKAAKEAEKAEKATAKAALLDRLGITEAESKLLLQ